MEIKPVDLRTIDKEAANIYESVIVVARRAKQINDDTRLEFNSHVTSIPAKGIDDDNEEIGNPDQLKISLEFEKRPKPHLAALNELLDGKIKYRYKE